MKEYIEKIKEWWKVPRYKALIKLGFYLIFLTLVIAMINNAPRVEEKPNVVKEELTSYDFVYKITQGNEEKIINGVHYKDTEKLVDADTIYYYKGESLYLNKELTSDFSPFPLYKMRYDNILKLAVERNIIDRTVYDDYEITNYQVFGEDFEYDHDFVLTIKKSDKYITQATINIKEQNYKIEIEYSNFNTITNLEINV